MACRIVLKTIRALIRIWIDTSVYRQFNMTYRDRGRALIGQYTLDIESQSIGQVKICNTSHMRDKHKINVLLLQGRKDGELPSFRTNLKI